MGGPSSKEPRTDIRPQYGWRVLPEPYSSSSSPGRFIGVVIKHAILFDYFATQRSIVAGLSVHPTSLLSMLFDKDTFPVQHSTLNFKHHCFQGHVASVSLLTTAVVSWTRLWRLLRSQCPLKMYPAGGWDNGGFDRDDGGDGTYIDSGGKGLIPR